MASSTRVRVVWLTLTRPASTRDTVARETPARTATSSIVGRRPVRPGRASLTGRSSDALDRYGVPGRRPGADRAVGHVAGDDRGRAGRAGGGGALVAGHTLTGGACVYAMYKG